MYWIGLEGYWLQACGVTGKVEKWGLKNGKFGKNEKILKMSRMKRWNTRMQVRHWFIIIILLTKKVEKIFYVSLNFIILWFYA